MDEIDDNFLPDKKPQKSARGPPDADDDLSEFCWGAAAIAHVLGLSVNKFRHLNSKGVFGSAVFQLGHRTIGGHKPSLRQFHRNLPSHSSKPIPSAKSKKRA